MSKELIRVGDTVEIVKGEGWHDWVVSDMKSLEGTFAKVSSVNEISNGRLEVYLKDNGYVWNPQNLKVCKREAKKFAVGDKVRVRKGLKDGMENFIKSMERHIGEEMELTSNYGHHYSAMNCWSWHDYMLELVEPAKPIEPPKTKVYLASPFFNDTEIAFVSTVEHILRSKGLDVWSPRENQLEDKELVHGTSEWSKAIFDNDIENLEAADVVVAIMHGNYSDAGTAMEVGYSFNGYKPIIIVHVGEDSNLMIHEAATANLRLEELVSYDFNTLPEKQYEGKMF